MTAPAFAEFPERLPCLTLWPEWAFAIVHYGKPVENRGWPPPKILEGKWIGIHAGKKIGGSEMSERDGIDCMMRTGDLAGVRFDCHRLTSLSSAAYNQLAARLIEEVRSESSRLVAVVRLGSASPPVESAYLMRQWRVLAQWGWQFSEMAPLSEPIQCRGAQGLWRLSEEMTARVKASLSDPQRRINP